MCDFLEICDKSKPFTCLSTIKRGHYGLLDVHVKIRILHELVSEAITTNVIREKLDEYVEKHRVLMARKREEGRLKKQEESAINRKLVLGNGKNDMEISSIQGNHKFNETHLQNGVEDHKPNGNYDTENRYVIQN